MSTLSCGPDSPLCSQIEGKELFMLFSPGETTFAGRDETAVIAKPLGNQHTPRPNEWPLLEACPAHAWRIRKTGNNHPLRTCYRARIFFSSV
jgi:hypothetical protein